MTNMTEAARYGKLHLQIKLRFSIRPRSEGDQEVEDV